MKIQNLFSGKNKKNISKCCMLKIFPSILSVQSVGGMVALGLKSISL